MKTILALIIIFSIAHCVDKPRIYCNKEFFDCTRVCSAICERSITRATQFGKCFTKCNEPCRKEYCKARMVE